MTVHAARSWWTPWSKVTGRPAQEPEPVAVSLVISHQTLLAGYNGSAVMSGYGPIPAAVARRLIDGAVTDRRSRATLCRLYRHPATGALVAMESRSRCFRGVCPRTSGCATKPVAHRTVTRRSGTAITPSRTTATGRPAPKTVWVNANAATKSRNSPGCQVIAGSENGIHTAKFVTPTGKRYRSTAPPVPGRLW